MVTANLVLVCVYIYIYVIYIYCIHNVYKVYIMYIPGIFQSYAVLTNTCLVYTYFATHGFVQYLFL